MARKTQRRTKTRKKPQARPSNQQIYRNVLARAGKEAGVGAEDISTVLEALERGEPPLVKPELMFRIALKLTSAARDVRNDSVAKGAKALEGWIGFRPRTDARSEFGLLVAQMVDELQLAAVARRSDE
jgi:hypothetical protein